MRHHTVSAARGIVWIQAAARLLLQDPAPFALMGLLLAMVGFVPLLGGLALLVFGPALQGGMVHAAARRRRGDGAVPGHLFEAFRRPGALRPMLLLCLPNIALLALLAALSVVALFASGLAAAVMAAAERGEMVSTQTLLGALGGGGLLLFALVLIPLALLVGALLFFAVPAVMLRGTEPFAAMRASLTACLSSPGAFLFAILGIALLRLVLMLLLGSISPALAALAIGVVVEPLLAVTGYQAFSDVFGDDQAPAAGSRPAVMSAEL